MRIIDMSVCGLDLPAPNNERRFITRSKVAPKTRQSWGTLWAVAAIPVFWACASNAAQPTAVAYTSVVQFQGTAEEAQNNYRYDLWVWTGSEYTFHNSCFAKGDRTVKCPFQYALPSGVTVQVGAILGDVVKWNQILTVGSNLPEFHAANRLTSMNSPGRYDIKIDPQTGVIYEWVDRVHPQPKNMINQQMGSALQIATHNENKKWLRDNPVCPSSQYYWNPTQAGTLCKNGDEGIANPAPYAYCNGSLLNTSAASTCNGILSTNWAQMYNWVYSKGDPYPGPLNPLDTDWLYSNIENHTDYVRVHVRQKMYETTLTGEFGFELPTLYVNNYVRTLYYPTSSGIGPPLNVPTGLDNWSQFLTDKPQGPLNWFSMTDGTSYVTIAIKYGALMQSVGGLQNSAYSITTDNDAQNVKISVGYTMPFALNTDYTLEYYIFPYSPTEIVPSLGTTIPNWISTQGNAYP